MTDLPMTIPRLRLNPNTLNQKDTCNSSTRKMHDIACIYPHNAIALVGLVAPHLKFAMNKTKKKGGEKKADKNVYAYELEQVH